MYSFDRYYLYRHIRLDKNEPFYIGIGTKNDRKAYTDIYNRAYSKFGRNNVWKAIANKTDWIVEIFFETDDYQFLSQKESEFINLYGRIITKEGPLANFKLLDDPQNGYKLSEKQIQKIKDSNKGQKRSEETKRKISENSKKQDFSHFWKQVDQFTMEEEYIQSFSSIKQAKEHIGHKNDANIVACCKNKRQQCGGFRWKYKLQ